MKIILYNKLQHQIFLQKTFVFLNKTNIIGSDYVQLDTVGHAANKLV